MIKKFKTKPFEIEAVLFTGDNEAEVQQMCAKDFWLLDPINFDQVDEGIIAEVFDKLHSTWVGVKAGQWIIKGQKGEFYPCDPEIFALKYEEVVHPSWHQNKKTGSSKPMNEIRRTFGTGEM